MPYLNPPKAQRPAVLPVMPDTAPSPSRPPEEAVGIQAPTHRSPNEVILDTVDDALVLARQGRVQVHPYFHGLGQALFNAWHPEPAVEEVSPQVLVQRDRPKPQGFIDAWRKRAEVYGRTGSPLSDMRVPRPPPANAPQ